MMPTPCEEAATDLAEIKAAIKASATGTRVAGWRHGDKGMDFSAGNITALLAERRRLQAIVNRCNGVSSGPFIQITPSDE